MPYPMKNALLVGGPYDGKMFFNQDLRPITLQVAEGLEFREFICECRVVRIHDGTLHRAYVWPGTSDDEVITKVVKWATDNLKRGDE